MFSCVLNTEQNKAVIAGADGIADAGRDDLIVGIHSAIGKEGIRTPDELASGKDLTLLDVPVTGGSFGADVGTLTVMGSGPIDSFVQAKPKLETFSNNIYHFSEKLGAGQIAKAANKMMLLPSYVNYVEGMALSEKNGLDLDLVHEFVKVATGNSFVNENWSAVEYYGTSRQMLYLAQKEVSASINEGTAIGLEMPATSLAHDIIDRWHDAGSIQKYTERW